MIAACPKCSARYRVDETKIGSEGVRLRCAKCEAVFRVRAPEAAAAPVPAPSPQATVAPEPQVAAAPAPQATAAPSPQATAAPAPQVAAAPAPQAAPAPAAASAQPPAQAAAASPVARTAPEGEAPVDRERLVLIADPDIERGKATAHVLGSWGLQTLLVHDGVDAMLTIQRTLPRAVVLDAALPKMYGFQICEVIKRNDSLRDTGVVLVGAINDQDRYRRPPSELYGADVYLEQPSLPDALLDVVRGFGMTVVDPAEAASAPSPPPAPAAPQAAAAPPPIVESPAAPPAPDQALADARSQAERLARIIVSDIILYHPEKFEEAIRAGNVVAALESDIEEGRSLFRHRVDEQIRDEKDYIVEELVRVARDRGMQ